MSEFKVLLVYPNLQMVNLLPSNIAILSASLKKAGFDVRLFDTTLYRTEHKSVDDIRVEHAQLRPFNLEEKGITYKTTDLYEDFVSLVDHYQPNLIGVTAVDDTYDLGISLLSKVADKNIHKIVGGIYPTFSPLEVLSNPHVDSICIGEGEQALVELCQNLQGGKNGTDIPSIWTKNGGRIFKNEIRQPLDKEKSPFEDFSIFEEKRFYRPMQGKIHKMIPVMIDRGCPYSCTFCAAPLLRKLYVNAGWKNYFRVKCVKRIIEELDYFVKEYGMDYVYFNSETFFAGKDKDIVDFAHEYAAKIRLPFWCQTRIETITERKIKILEDMNCDRISIGIEHGNEEFRRKVLKKNFSNNQVIRAFRMLEKSKIPITANNIVGFPDETRELVFDTIYLNRQIEADSINAYFLVPYRGSPLRQYCIDKGYVDKNAKTDSPMRSSILRMPQSFFTTIKMAEKLDEEGDKVFAELRNIYFPNYFC